MRKVYFIVGILLILCSVILLSYTGFEYTTQEKVAEIGNVTITAEEEKVIPFSPIAGGIALVIGVGLLIAAKRK